MLINSKDEQKELSCFERDDKTDAYGSCSVNWRNQFHVFGGFNEKRQISRLNDYRLERIGSLAFDHGHGACSVMANQFIFVCFQFVSSDYKRCRRSTGPLKTFTEITPSNHDHGGATTSCFESQSFCIKSLNKTFFRWTCCSRIILS